MWKVALTWADVIFYSDSSYYCRCFSEFSVNWSYSCFAYSKTFFKFYLENQEKIPSASSGELKVCCFISTFQYGLQPDRLKTIALKWTVIYLVLSVNYFMLSKTDI